MIKHVNQINIMLAAVGAAVVLYALSETLWSPAPPFDLQLSQLPAADSRTVPQRRGAPEAQAVFRRAATTQAAPVESVAPAVPMDVRAIDGEPQGLEPESAPLDDGAIAPEQIPSMSPEQLDSVSGLKRTAPPRTVGRRAVPRPVWQGPGRPDAANAARPQTRMQDLRGQEPPFLPPETQGAKRDASDELEGPPVRSSAQGPPPRE